MSEISLPGGGRVVINPGTEAVPEATVANALANMVALATDLGWDDPCIGRDVAADYGDGRFAFTITSPRGRVRAIQMPGLPLSQMRLGPWRSPRLYVDGSSWLWAFALGILADTEGEDTPAGDS